MELSRGSLLKGFAGMAILPFLPKLSSPSPPPASPPPLVPPRTPRRAIVGWRFISDKHPLANNELVRQLPPVTIKLYNGDTLVEQMYCPQGTITEHFFPMGMARTVTRAEVVGGTGRFEFARL